MLVYKITNSLTGKAYIGMTQHTLRRRWLAHVHDALSCRLNGALQRAIRLHGADQFSIDVCAEPATRAAAAQIEKDLIASLGTAAPAGYNLTIGGDGGPTRTGYKNSEAMRAKAAAGNRGKKWPEAARRNFSIVRTGLKLSDKARANISRGLTGRVPTAETRAKIAKAHAGLDRPLLSAFLLQTSKPFGNPSSTGARGVSKRPNGKWRARVGVKGKRIALGDFETLEEAVKAREAAAAGYAAALIAEAAQKTLPSGNPTLSQHPNSIPGPP